MKLSINNTLYNVCRYGFDECCYVQRCDLYFAFLNFFMLSVVMLSVVAPIEGLVLYAQANIRLRIKNYHRQTVSLSCQQLLSSMLSIPCVFIV
jgi:hypothetical protein